MKKSDKTTPVERSFKNPLAQALGMILQKMRNAAVLSSDEVALKLGLGGSSYRMIEAGSALLQPGKALRVIQVFERIEFTPLCKLLTALQVLESGSGKSDDMRWTCTQLSEAEPQLHDVVQALAPVWPVLEKEDPGRIGEILREQKTDLALEIFLTTPSPSVVDHQGVLQAHVHSLLNSTPPFYFDLAVDMLENLQGYVPRVSPTELAKWEEKNKSRITNVLGIIRDSRSWTHPENFELFVYGFLWENHFETFRLLVTAPSRKDVVREFEDHLKSAIQQSTRRNDPRLAHMKTAVAKLDVRVGIQHPSIESVFLCDGVVMNNLWFYKLRGGHVVAFADNYEVDARENVLYYGTSFTYGETIQKLKSLEIIWNETR